MCILIMFFSSMCVLVNMRGKDNVSMKDFELLKVLGTGGWAKL